MLNEKNFIGIDVGGTKILGGLVTPAGVILCQHKLATPPKAGAKEICALIDKIVKTLLLESGQKTSELAGIGLAIPGIVDNAGRVLATPNLNLEKSDLKNILEKRLHLRVSIGNDVNLGVLGEQWLGAGRKASSIVGIFPGTGIGGGIVINGKLMTGSQGAAAELGHMTVDPLGPECSCGNRGCLEALAGRWAIERDIRAAIKKGEHSLITELADRNLERIKSSALARALQLKDPLVTRIMDAAAQSLAYSCVSLNHLFNPDIFLFGGGLIEACGDFILARVEKALKADPFFKKLPPPRVISARLGDDAVMLGAVAIALQNAGHTRLATLSYPQIKISTEGSIRIDGKPFASTTLVRADGKIKQPQECLRQIINDKNLAWLCKKGPDSLYIACAPGVRTAFSPKGLRLLRKKKISFCILPLRRALAAYNKNSDRKTIVFVL
jgi:glucokinase